MTPQQESHLEQIKQQTLERLTAKYTRGTEEHGGYLGDKPVLELVEEAVSEAIDQMTYLVTLQTQLRAVKDEAILVKTHQSGGGILMPKHVGDCGYDLVASETTIVPPFGSTPASVPIGISLKLPPNKWAEIRPRSSTATKLGIFAFQSVIDGGYTGPWFVVCTALGNQPITVEKGTRLAQCILHNIAVHDIMEVDELPETSRGDSGFGSTGLTV